MSGGGAFVPRNECPGRHFVLGTAIPPTAVVNKPARMHTINNAIAILR